MMKHPWNGEKKEKKWKKAFKGKNTENLWRKIASNNTKLSSLSAATNGTKILALINSIIHVYSALQMTQKKDSFTQRSMLLD